ncbi:Uncharacterised protein [Chlamydia trachomatis]|nr:Uncharacterised protein [Chlamydia trachomatis]
MEAHSFNNCPQQLRLTGLNTDIEKHSARIWIFEGAAIAVQPRGENYSSGARFCLLYHFIHIGIKILILWLFICFLWIDIRAVEVDVNFI